MLERRLKKLTRLWLIIMVSRGWCKPPDIECGCNTVCALLYQCDQCVDGEFNRVPVTHCTSKRWSGILKGEKTNCLALKFLPAMLKIYTPLAD